MKNNIGDNIFSNPLTLTGLSVLGGKDLGTALNDAAVQSRNYQILQAQRAEMQQQQYLRENIGQIMQNIDPNDLPGSFARLVQSGIPPQNASAFIENIRKQQAQQQLQGLLSGILGGGGAAGVTPGVTQGVTGEAQGAGGIPTAGGGNDMARKGMALMVAGALGGNTGISNLGQALNQQANNDRTYGSGREDQMFRRARELSNDFVKDSKPYVDIKNSFQNMVDAASQPSGAGDIKMVYTFMKLLDPTSVVREGEATTAAKAGGVPARIVNIYNGLVNGEKLSPKVREDFINQAQSIYNNQAKSHKLRIQQYSKRAKAFKLSPDMVIQDFGGVQLPGEDNASIDSTIENIPQGNSVLPKAQPGQSKAEAAAGDYTPQDLEYTAKKYGISVYEVKRRLGGR